MLSTKKSAIKHDQLKGWFENPYFLNLQLYKVSTFPGMFEFFSRGEKKADVRHLVEKGSHVGRIGRPQFVFLTVHVFCLRT